MLTQGKIDQFYKDVNLLKLKYPVAEIQRATKFPKSNVSEWLSKKKTPSENFINVFYDKFKAMLHSSSINVHHLSANDITAIDRSGNVMAIEIKTASGKTIQVKPEGHSEITLLNAFLEERDRVIDTLKEEKQARIDELVKEKEALHKLLNSGLFDIAKVQQAIFAMVRTLQEHEAVIASSGNKKREVEMLNTLSKLNGDNLKIDAKQDNALVLHMSGK